ncbi:MAG TPA: Crp/Fnr family transcriptional regulator [Flavisolibacter sp.]|nr:Crp/Fnr family transcriptional regulator [Flavisolibacter sp.]
MYELILQNVSRHISLTEEEKEHFLSLLQPRKLRRHQYLVQAGDPCRYECFVNSGIVRQYYLDNKGTEHIAMFGMPDWWVSDMFGLVTGRASLTNIDALTDCEVLLIERTAYEQLMLDIPKFERFFRILLQRAYINQQQRIIEGISLPADERYLIFTERYPALEQALPLRHIASYLGITPESLSRIRRQRASRQGG